MGRHSPAVAQLDQFEADRARRRALELLAELDVIIDDMDSDPRDIWRWAGRATAILKELARG